MRKAVIVIPTYNEAGNIQNLIEQIFAEAEKIDDWSVELLIVDSNSPDKTAAIVKSLQKNYPELHILETKKEGLGKAYIQGFDYAIENLKAYIVFEMDADFSHDPKKIPDFL